MYFDNPVNLDFDKIDKCIRNLLWSWARDVTMNLLKK